MTATWMTATEFHWKCELCGRGYRLLARVWRGGKDKYLCADCWRDQGSPYPNAKPASYAQEEAVREAMLRRGGTDAYRVRAGKS